MNHIHRIIWNKTLGAWIVTSELAKRGKKCGSIRRNALILPLLLYASAGFALPTGNELVAGSVNVTTPSAEQMQINQNSQKAIVNWQGFSIAEHERVNIQQPNANAALLNRVVGQDASNIQGKLNANGQVYLVNPNGVIFSKTAQVDVGGLITGTHDISNQDFLNGKLHFTQNNAKGSVINHGQIKTPEGGVVALIGEQVENTGSINTPKGTTALAAGKTVDLDIQGDGLVEVKISEAALNAQIKNNGVIQADGGQVIMTAKAAGQLLNTVINNEGIVQAQGMIERNGKIVLSGGDNGVVQVSSTLDAGGQPSSSNDSNPESSNTQGGNITVSGHQININNGAILNASGDAGGGTIVIGDRQSTNQATLHSGSSITAQARDHGNAGKIEVLANKDNGTVKVEGQLDASAPKQGDGGVIDTSAAHVKVAGTAKISTQATNGKTGTWLIDPTDFTIAASGGDITGAALSTNLSSTNVAIASTAGSTGVNGDVNVNDVVTWSENQLTLNAQRNININANLNGSFIAQLALQYGQASVSGDVNDNYFINNGAKVTLPAGANFSTQKGSNVANLKNYTVITALGAPGSVTATDLQGMNSNPKINYALGADIDASATSTWNLVGSGTPPIFQGFEPVGNSTTQFSGNFDGLGHTITNLTINRPSTNNVGLFGSTTTSSTISNLGLVGGSIIGFENVGGIVGRNLGTISNAFATGNVTGGANNIGGLVGYSNGAISNAYATGFVTGSIQSSEVGGLAGRNDSSISNAYATGSVTSGINGDAVGGLVGLNVGSISNAYATGTVTGHNTVGGLVGNGGTISNAFWDTQSTGQINGVGGAVGNSPGVTGKTSAEMKQIATFSSAGWTISDTGGSGAVWRIYEGFTAPLLRSFLTPLTVTADNISKTYDGVIVNALSNPSYSIPGAASGHLFNTTNPYNGAVNVGTTTYTPTGLYSDQQGYDISIIDAVLTINPATLTYTADTSSRLYGAANPVFTGTVTGFVNADTLASATTGAASFTSLADSFSNAGNYAIDGSGLTANNGNYTFTQAASNAAALSITPAILTYTADTSSRPYGAANPVFTGTVTGFVNADTLASATTGAASFTSLADNFSNAGNYAIDGSGLTANNGNYTFTQAASNAAALSITPAILTYTADTSSRLYGAANPAFTGTVTGFVNGDTLASATTGAASFTSLADSLSNAGSYAIDGAGLAANNGNYDFTQAAGNASALSITPAILTYTADASSRLYGAANPAFTGTVTGFVNGDTLASATTGAANFTSLADSLSNVGSYAIDGSGLTANNGNYDFAQAAGNAAALSITPAILTYTADASSRLYGAANPAFTGTVTGFVNADTLASATTGAASFTSLADNFSNAGNYAIDGSGLTANNGNYTFTQAASNAAALSITPAILTYTADTSSRLYGAANPAFTGTVTGFVNGDTLASATTGAASFISLADSLSNAGSYAIDGSGLTANNGNYDFAQAAGNATALSITPATLTAAITGDPTKIYDSTTAATLAAANYTLTGFIDTQGAIVTQSAGTYNSADVVTADTVTAALAPSDFTANPGTLLSNYSLPTTASGPGHISAAALTAAITGNPTKTYDSTTAAALTAANYTLTGFIDKQGASVTQTSGTYNSAGVVTANTVTAALAPTDFTANAGTLLSNYNLPTTAAGAGAITPVLMTITANNDRKIYDGLAYTGGNGVTYAGLVNNETSSVLTGNLNYGGSSQGAINPGAYTITPQGLSADNYRITYLDGRLNIVDGVSPFVPIKEPINNNVVPLVTSVTSDNSGTTLQQTTYDSSATLSNFVLANATVHDVTDDFIGNPTNLPGNNPFFKFISVQDDKKHPIVPILKIKNSAGRVKRMQLSANRQFLSLLLEDGSVRVWDFQAGVQRQIVTPNTNQALTDISAVDGKGESLSIASKTGIGTRDIISLTLDNKMNIKEPEINQFMTSNDGSLLLVSAGADQLSLWDSKQNKQLWQLPYERGVVSGLALSDNKHYGAVLSRQPGSYVLLPADLQFKSLTDAVDIVDLGTGKIIKSLPNEGEQIVSMQFKDNDTLQLRLASGELLDWSITMGSKKAVANFAETVTAVDPATNNYAYVLEDGTVRVGDGQGHVLLSIKNEKNPFQSAKLLEGDKKLLTVMANGELSLWDVASGKKLLRLFSTQQGWTVMDAFGRFDGSEEAMENFSWSANEEDIPLDSFSENYYEPGLLTNVLQNQDYLNSNPSMVQNGITLPPKVVLQIAGQQAKGDSMALQLDVYDRGGGIDQIHVYQNGKVLSNESIVTTQQTLQENGAEHRVLTLNITPRAGKNTLKVIASNDMGIENSSTELSFDGKTKAYTSSLRLMTVGIDQYSDPRLNLEYSVNDADSIGQAIKTSSKIASIKSLTNENATKPNILAELKELSQGTQQDVLVIYFAGHGMAIGKEWYFLPYETKMQPTLEQIAATGITAKELSDIFKDSKIQHILLLVDSCYSGAGMDAFSKLENGQHYFTRKLSRSLGITVITAAAKDQEAFELKSLGHGLFTYLMTQELQEKDAAQPLTAHGIAENITKTLPVFSKKMLGSSQEPVAYTKGNDFMLTDVSKESSKGSAPDVNTPAIAPQQLDQ